MTFKLPTN